MLLCASFNIQMDLRNCVFFLLRLAAITTYRFQFKASLDRQVVLCDTPVPEHHCQQSRSLPYPAAWIIATSISADHCHIQLYGPLSSPAVQNIVTSSCTDHHQTGQGVLVLKLASGLCICTQESHILHGIDLKLLHVCPWADAAMGRHDMLILILHHVTVQALI